MRFAIQFLLVAFLALLAAAATPHREQKPVIVSFDKDTPQDVLDQAMDAIKKAGGMITHEYTIIKGFAAKATKEAVDTVHALGTQHNVVIEDDQIITTNDN